MQGIHWVIVGGESGPGARPMQQVWVESIHRQCIDAAVPSSLSSGVVSQRHDGKSTSRRTYDEMPTSRPTKAGDLFPIHA